ncbi:MAG: LLM class flavin-dependent oxidoreductase [Spirochaetaceae bacterium]|nr:LLM class flavin-dependent oxidoreductase [Myxococcales bacterium]MCB9726454.1 LLM class flavin-dependent oxidoreductase [Spirochaetaceae bacterium]HPG25468.1 LLM class flavin-dependent oxidoreductase [Myxococcota bacterium]
MFTMRFDMRAPEFGAPRADLYRAAIEMADWGEKNGCAAVQVCEHHRSKDGYLPTPMILASAIAARTRSLPIQIAALIVPLHDPVELAEQMAVLDLVSAGRVSYVVAIGYVPAEYALFGREMKGRGRRLEESVRVMQRLWAGEEFEYQGRPVKVTPLPHTPGGPAMMMGGGVAATARRAARLGMGMLAMGNDPNLETIYAEACRAEGREPGICINPTPGAAMSAFVAKDPDEAWAKWGPHLLHDAQAYAEWMGDDIGSATKSIAGSVEALRAENGNYRIFSVDEAVEEIRKNGVMMTQPLCGGMPIDYAWESLETLVREVLPRVKSGG